MNLAKQLGGDGFNDMTADEANDLIDAHAQPLTDKDLAEMTKPPSEDDGEEEEEDTLVDKEEEEGLTLGRLATMMRMATELQRAAQEWDPLMCRSLQFSNIIEGGMSVYKNLLAQKKRVPTTTHNDVLLSEKDPCAAFSRKKRYSAAESGRRGAAGGTVKYASDNVSYLVFITI